MKNRFFSTSKASGGLLRILLAGTVLISMSGCSGNYGRLKMTEDVDRIFQDFRILPDHRYYFSGRENNPTALIGIQKEYTLTTSLWKEVDDMTPEKLKNWVEWIRLDFSDDPYGYGAYGSAILSPAGERIGIWYSKQPWTVVRVYDGKQVTVFRPEEPGMRDGPGDQIRND